MKVSEAHTLSYLAKHPRTKDIVLEHLRPIITHENQLNQVHATLKELADRNMGGGIPYDTMEALTAQLDKLSLKDL